MMIKTLVTMTMMMMMTMIMMWYDDDVDNDDGDDDNDNDGDEDYVGNEGNGFDCLLSILDNDTGDHCNYGDDKWTCTVDLCQSM